MNPYNNNTLVSYLLFLDLLTTSNLFVELLKFFLQRNL